MCRVGFGPPMVRFIALALFNKVCISIDFVGVWIPNVGITLCVTLKF